MCSRSAYIYIVYTSILYIYCIINLLRLTKKLLPVKCNTPPKKELPIWCNILLWKKKKLKKKHFYNSAITTCTHCASNIVHSLYVKKDKPDEWCLKILLHFREGSVWFRCRSTEISMTDGSFCFIKSQPVDDCLGILQSQQGLSFSKPTPN